MRRVRVYVAGPLSTGVRWENIRHAEGVGRSLVRMGYAPLIPHLTSYVDPDDSLGWEAWLQVDEAWLEQADVCLRLPGDSPGSDREVAFCEARGIPFVHSKEELIERFPVEDPWFDEGEDLLGRFGVELRKATGDGSIKRQSGQKPPWYRDRDHERAIFSHLTKWKAGALVDADSGAHPLVHAAWRCLAIACSETGNHPAEPQVARILQFKTREEMVAAREKYAEGQVEAQEDVLQELLDRYGYIPVYAPQVSEAAS